MGMFGAIGAIAGGLIGGPAGAAVGGSIGGGIDSAQAQDKANQANRNLSREQMRFQERMSSSAHQRQVEDMKKAGLNPMLSGMGGSGASSPSGSLATMEPVDTKMGENISKTIQFKMEEQALENAKLQAEQTKAQTQKTHVEKNLLKATEPEAQIRNSIGKKVQKKLENWSSSARDLEKPSFKEMKRHTFESHYQKKAESKAKKNYKKSQAARDAAKARARRNK